MAALILRVSITQSWSKGLIYNPDTLDPDFFLAKGGLKINVNCFFPLEIGSEFRGVLILFL